ncbi:MAG: ABC transporter ATP-binding protein/permease [Bacteroidales bacterium]|jgi:subfamily B ATP-binding cassette protein MsbA|nr:ABC transporter ATP-binding protein/permease [Bacteroidales bacterium]
MYKYKYKTRLPQGKIKVGCRQKEDYINKRYFSLLFAKPYLFNIFLYLILICLATIFSIASILSASNFLSVLFPSAESTNIVSNPSLLDNFLGEIYDKIIVNGREKALFIFGGIIFVIYFFKDAFTYLSSFLIASVRNKIVRNIRNKLFSKYLSLPLSYLTNHRKGDLISRLSNDVIEYDENVLKSIIALFSSIITVLLYFIALIYIDYKLTLTVLFCFPLIAGLVSIISRSLRRKSENLQQKNANLISIMEQTISGLRIIKAHTAIEMINNRFVNFNASYTRLKNRIYRRVDLASPVSEFFGNLLLIGLLIFGSSMVLSSNATLSAELFISYLVLFVLIIKPAKDIPTSFFNIKKGKASIDRITTLLNTENNIKEPVLPVKIKELEHGIRYENVSFAYKEELVLKNINIEFKKGETTAIVGLSGSGKSTLIDLLSKFYIPTSGNIFFDEENINDILSKDLRENIAVVSQDTILFNDSVSNNISFGRNYSKQEIINAAKIANADEFIMQMSQGYNTQIGDRGTTLSGGQKQRISIARAVLKNAPILVLDEATSALDTLSERLVQDAINTITKGRTSIIIAHRLSTIVDADKIIVLDRGEVVQEGKHKDLILEEGLYKKLCLMQKIRQEN